MKVLKFSFLFYAIWLIIGIVSASSMSIIQSRIGLVASALLLLFLCFNQINKRIHSTKSFFYLNVFLLISSCFFLGSSSMQLSQSDRLDVPSNLSVSQNTFIVEIKKKLKPSTSYFRYVSDVHAIDQHQTKGLLLLNLKKDSLKVGDVVVFKSKALSFYDAKNIGQFDYQKYNYNQGIERQVFISNYNVLEHNRTVFSIVGEWRDQLLDKINVNTILTEDSKAFVAALMLGDKSSISSETQSVFKELGIMHILAISGLHIGILFIFLESVLKPLPNKIRLVCILICLWIFVFISGFSPSVFRAVLMFTAIAIVKGLRRNTSTLHIVSLSLFLSLVFKPMWLYDVGFQLSYSAVLGIVLVMPLFDKFYSKSKVVRYFQSLVFVSIVAQLSVLPLQLYYFGQFPVFFLPTNILIIPLVTIFLLLGISWILLVFISEMLSYYVALLLNQISDLILITTSYLTNISWAKSIPVAIDGMQTVLLGCIVLSACFWVFNKSLRNVTVLVITCIVFQVSFIVNQKNINSSNELIIPYSFKEDFTVYNRRGNTIYWYGQEGDETKRTFQDYKKTIKPNIVKYFEEQFVYSIGAKTYLILSASNEMYNVNVKRKVTHLVFQGKIQLNYERVLGYVQPEEVVIHNTVPFWLKDMIIASCIKKEIPYYDIGNKGFYRMPYEL